METRPSYPVIGATTSTAKVINKKGSREIKEWSVCLSKKEEMASKGQKASSLVSGVCGFSSNL